MTSEKLKETIMSAIHQSIPELRRQMPGMVETMDPSHFEGMCIYFMLHGMRLATVTASIKKVPLHEVDMAVLALQNELLPRS